MMSCVQHLHPVNRPLSWQTLAPPSPEPYLKFHFPPLDDSALSAFHPSLVCSVPVVPRVNKSRKVTWNSLTVFFPPVFISYTVLSQDQCPWSFLQHLLPNKNILVMDLSVLSDTCVMTIRRLSSRKVSVFCCVDFLKQNGVLAPRT